MHSTCGVLYTVLAGFILNNALTFQYQSVFNSQFVSKGGGQCALFSGEPSDMISHSACRVLYFRCFHTNFHNTSWTCIQMHVYFVYRQVETSNRSCVAWVHPAECICQVDIIAWNVLDATVVYEVAYAPTWVGQRRGVWCIWTQAVYGPYTLLRAVHIGIGGIAHVQTRCPIFRVQCWSSDFLFQSATCYNLCNDPYRSKQQYNTTAHEFAHQLLLKWALYIIWCGVNRLGDSGVKVV